MRTLVVSDVPDEVVERLEQLADREGVSVEALVLRHLDEVARQRTNAEIFAELPSLHISTASTLKVLDEGRAGR